MFVLCCTAMKKIVLFQVYKCGSHQLPSSELEEEEEREKLFKLIDTWNDLVHQGVFQI